MDLADGMATKVPTGSLRWASAEKTVPTFGQWPLKNLSHLGAVGHHIMHTARAADLTALAQDGLHRNEIGLLVEDTPLSHELVLKSHRAKIAEVERRGEPDFAAETDQGPTGQLVQNHRLKATMQDAWRAVVAFAEGEACAHAVTITLKSKLKTDWVMWSTPETGLIWTEGVAVERCRPGRRHFVPPSKSADNEVMTGKS